MQVNVKDAASGAIFILIAAWFVYGTQELEIGTPRAMGPGFFPIMLAGILALIGAIVLIKGFVSHKPWDMTPVPWRGGALILLAPIAFGMMVRGFPPLGIPTLGLVPSVAVSILIASFASRRMTVPKALALTAILTVFCLIVFQKMLGLPIPPFGGPLDWLNPYVEAAYAPFVAAWAALKSLISG